MTTERINSLFIKYRDNTLNEEERAELETWYLQQARVNKPMNSADDFRQAMAAMDRAFPFAETTGQVVRMKTGYKVAAAAIVFLLLSFGLLFYFSNRQPVQQSLLSKNDIAPGSNKAILTLANGRSIVLTGAKNGKLAELDNADISKTADGQVVYHTSKTAAAGGDLNAALNMLATPRGGQYNLVLADGTKVWLNAASSIKYPTVFTGAERRVEITGEAYFEVAHNAAKPFKVITNGQTVEVLGTHFNINAYADETATKTTLLQGSVRVSKGAQSAILKPGQQSIIQSINNSILINNNADTEEALAWHQGLFKFHEADIPAVMRQLSRWYDVDISYEGKISELRFSGKIYRNVTALKVSDILNYANIHFRIEGNKIIVTP